MILSILQLHSHDTSKQITYFVIQYQIPLLFIKKEIIPHFVFSNVLNHFKCRCDNYVENK